MAAFLSPLSCPGSGALTHASLYLVGAPPWQMELAQEERTPWPPGQGTGSVESDEAACAGCGAGEQAAPNPGGGRSGKCQMLPSQLPGLPLSRAYQQDLSQSLPGGSGAWKHSGFAGEFF